MYPEHLLGGEVLDGGAFGGLGLAFGIKTNGSPDFEGLRLGDVLVDLDLGFGHDLLEVRLVLDEGLVEPRLDLIELTGDEPEVLRVVVLEAKDVQQRVQLAVPLLNGRHILFVDVLHQGVEITTVMQKTPRT